MLRLLLITILLTEYGIFELKAESTPSAGAKGLGKSSNEEKDRLRQSQENVWYQPARFHKTKADSTLNRKDPLPKFPGVQYRPQDLAEYIVRTGDTKGVVSAIRNLLRSKLLNRNDALSFLREVEGLIPEMRLTPKTEENTKNSVQYFVKRRNEELLKRARQKKVHQGDADGITTETALTTALVFAEGYQGPGKDIKESNHISANGSKPVNHLTPKELHNEIVMRNVIYKLAKEMFWHSLAGGERGAKRTLTRLITILEKDVHNRMVPQKVKEIILDSISAALVDSLSEYPRLFSKRNSMRYSPLRQRRNAMIRVKKA